MWTIILRCFKSTNRYVTFLLVENVQVDGGEGGVAAGVGFPLGHGAGFQGLVVHPENMNVTLHWASTEED